MVCTFLWHTGVPGIVPLLRCFIADRGATLGPPQHAEGSVQPLEGAAPHRRTVKVSDCGADRKEKRHFIDYLMLNMPGLASVCLPKPNQMSH